jgi:chromosome segregation ATPase
MSIEFISLLVGIFFILTFYIISKITKREDYMVDDYDEDDLPDNVRIIKKEVIVRDDSKINELNEENNILNNKISELNLEKDELLKRLEESNNHYLDYEKKNQREKEQMSNSIEELNNKILEKNKEISIINKDLNTIKSNFEIQEKDIDNYKKEIDSKIKSERLLTTSLKNKEKSYKEIIDNLKKEIDSYKQKNKDAIKDRDYFSKLIDDKENEIGRLKEKIDKLTDMLELDISEGSDNFGRFYSIHNLSELPSRFSEKIIKINNELDSDQFAYYLYDTTEDNERVKIYDNTQIKDIVHRLKQLNKINGKKDIFLIYQNKVYIYSID